MVTPQCQERIEVHVWHVPAPSRPQPGAGFWAALLLAPVLLIAAALALAAVAAVAVGSLAASTWTTLRARSVPPAQPAAAVEDPGETAIAELRERYARGEIEVHEYEQRVAWALRYRAAAWSPQQAE
jgi:uncharacterized membrane protein